MLTVEKELKVEGITEAANIRRGQGLMLLKCTKEHLIVYHRNKGMRMLKSGKMKYPRIYEEVKIIAMFRNCVQSITHLISF